MPGSIAFALVGSIELTKAPISASQPPLHDFPNPNPTGDSVADISSLLPLSLLFVAAVVVTIAACRFWFKVIDKDHGVLMRPMPGMVGLVPSGSKLDILYCFDVFVHQDKKKLTPTKGSDAKRTRRDRRELENIIFKLFERQPNWALKQLVQETDQPEVCASTQTLCFYSTMKLIMTLSSYGLVRLLSTDLFNFSLQQFLKEILNDLCVYNKRGPNQGTHELKPEYKKSTEEMDNV
ncbi:hypothetical protein GW17_00025156 [Ensete ventricosum]|nr:hypothetical protein GW17_00025156 [Ensete ventricosum]